jgi:hypothetical protein
MTSPQIAIGGLTRCCMAAVPDDENPVEGTFVECPAGPHDGSGVRFVDGKWRAGWMTEEWRARWIRKIK